MLTLFQCDTHFLGSDLARRVGATGTARYTHVALHENHLAVRQYPATVGARVYRLGIRRELDKVRPCQVSAVVVE